MLGEALKFVGGFFDRDAKAKTNEQNAALQRDFAQNSIRWRVADAKAAGVHPIYALGAPTMSASASYIPEDGFASQGAALGSALESQDLSRPINATRTLEERTAAAKETELRLEGLKLDNDIKRASVASSVQRIAQGLNPPMPAIDERTPFAVPANPESEKRPPLMLFGHRVLTPSGTSPMKAWEDQIGDEGPLSWLAQALVGSHMISHNVHERLSSAKRTPLSDSRGWRWLKRFERR